VNSDHPRIEGPELHPEITSSGVHLVQLAGDHPGFQDTAYRKRRDKIARLSMVWSPGQPVPDVPYTDAEHGVWRSILQALAPLHAARAGRAYHEACEIIRLPSERIPQLSEVNALLASHGGYRMVPAGGLVTARDFLMHLGVREFESTQYIRHQSRPFYTPEPDVVHELVGHAASLAHPQFTRLNELFGKAIALVNEDDAYDIAQLIRLYWWTVEFGVHKEDGTLKTCGAGLLSSVGELGEFEKRAKLIPFSVAEAIESDFDPTAYQGTLFVGESFDAVVDETAAYLERRIRR
jgi:phenylalanine-4-hydroxylase